MNLFVDTEFTHLSKDADLICMACVSENGDTFYAEFNDFDEDKVSDWVKENVYPHLRFRDRLTEVIGSSGEPDYVTSPNFQFKGNKSMVAHAFNQWLLDRGCTGIDYKMWFDFPVFDWILITEMFGGYDKFPPYIVSRPLDISVLFEDRTGDCAQSRESFAGATKDSMHDALADAWVLKKCYEILMDK